MKLSKLINEAKLLGYEAFSGTVDVIVSKNWMTKITDTIVDMELKNSLKLKVATRLMDKSAITWWENLKLCTTIPITLELFVREFND